MPKDYSRPSLSTSLSDFALPQPSSISLASSSAYTLDDTNNYFIHGPRFRRPSLLTPKAVYMSDARLHSPLATSFSLQPSPKHKDLGDDCRMRSDSSTSNSSENTTPAPEGGDSDKTIKRRRSKMMTPPRKASVSGDTDVRYPKRRLSFPVKQPRILNLLAESRPIEQEVKSEAVFQRLIASGAELPMHPRTPRAPSDRGRYPEEAGQDDYQREDSPSDDDDVDFDDAFSTYSSNDLAGFPSKSITPAGSVNGDDLSYMSISESPSLVSLPMDIDPPAGSPSISASSSFTSSTTHWRHTPPPTSSAVRSNKRKFDDRYDPYASASKRRAVSPSVSLLRDGHGIMSSPISRSNPRLPISIPISHSVSSSTTSSPTVSSGYPISIPRPLNMAASPTLRSCIGLASPILRPMTRTSRLLDGNDREVEGAGEAVGGLTLN